MHECGGKEKGGLDRDGRIGPFGSRIADRVELWMEQDRKPMAYNCTTCNRNQQYLLPPSMTEWLGDHHFVWFLLDAVERMDLSAFHKEHRRDGKGQKAHHPEIMLSVMLNGCC